MNKIFSPGTELKFPEGKIVFTNGCFDILHPGHLDYLRRARQLGDLLVVGLNSDKSVKSNKGDLRPINDFDFRATMLSYFNFIDCIIEFDEDTPLNLIRKIRPHVLVKGADYRNKDVAGSEFVKSINGEVVFLSFLDGYSTTKIVNKILKSHVQL